MAQTPAVRWCEGDMIDYTPAAAVAAGDVVVLGSRLLGVAVNDIAADALGALAVKGVFKVPKKTGAIAVGAPVYWNPTGTPVTGTADTGAAENTPAETNYPMGPAVLAAASGDEYVNVALDPAFLQRVPVNTVAATGTVQGDAAQVYEGFNLVTGADDAKGVILPPAVAGMQVWIKVGDGADLKVYPATGDAINAIAANGALTVVDDVCFVLTALNGTTWYTTPLLPS